eukprot:TRINITY_DN17787_c0_g1_i1.p1 TRINITY_DN17787_c0_g1~~TRINITY_DN17787_c0_g1_i1.p1  ORF type:complete len:579 (-),score=213.30 TRINITY_DN17787_c0_g1_i1:103-1839(-)
MAGKAKKICYYELLGVDRKCDPAEIKTSYRKLALKMHPDKAHINGESVEEATKKFQQIQEAYQVLSDAQERAWYDAHREQILKGDDEPGEDPFKTRINLFRYFSSSCFDGFDDGPRGFFQVYTELFEAIDAEEEQWEDADEDHVAMPPFGNSKTEWADVSAFYRNWTEFTSRKAFGHADQWNPKEAQNRQVRRAMEQENKKARQAAKKEFNAEVRQVVSFVQKRDPRWAEYQKRQMKEKGEKAAKEKADKEKKKAEQAKEREDRKEAARQAEEDRWAEVAAAKEARRARGEIVSEDEDSSEEEQVGWHCEPCRKSFKSEKAFDQHTKSKKHIQIVEQLRKELEKEMEEESEDDEEETEDDESEEEVVCPPAAPPKKEESDAGKAQKESVEEKEDDDDDEESEDDFLARFAARRQQPAVSSSSPKGRGRGKGGNGGYPSTNDGKSPADAADEDGDSDSEEEGSDEDDKKAGNIEGSGKRAQRKAELMAMLLERRQEKDNVQELVNNTKKAQRAAKKAEKDQVQASAGVVGEPPEGNICGVCKKDFASRSQLFAHVKEKGHALLKPMAGEAQAKGKKKKR